MRDLKNEFQTYDAEGHGEITRKKALDALKRMENWNLFTDTNEVH